MVEASVKKISFMRSLCMGRVEEEVLSPFPVLSQTEGETLRAVFGGIAPWLKGKEPLFRQWDREGSLPENFLQEMKDLGLFSLILPEEHGGLGLSSMAYSRVLQELAKYDGSVAITVGAHSSIGLKGLLLFGTPEQKARYAPALARGQMLAAFCLTEPVAGSDAASIQTKAVKDGEGWVLTGQKLWITNGGLADFFTVFARTDTSEGKLTAFIVTRQMPGVSCGPHEDKMGLRASSTTTVHFDQVKLGPEHVLGEVGKGFKVAMKILNSGRSGLGGGCVGAMKHVMSLASQQANQRVQFGKKIAEYGLIKKKLGQMVIDCYTTEAVVAVVAHLVDAGFEDYAVEAAISKVYATECLWRTADEGLQIAGGNGFMCEFPYERILRDCRVNRIFEGTNEILRLFIALTGLQEVGQELSELSHSLEGIFKDPIKGFGLLSEYSFRRFSQATGVGGEKKTFQHLHAQLQPQVQIFQEGVRQLAQVSDRLLRKHGKKIIGKQFATARLSDIMIDLFVLACTLSRVSRSVTLHGVSATQEEQHILSAFAAQVKYRLEAILRRIDDNEDEAIKALAEDLSEKETYRWDLFAEGNV